MLHSSMDFCKSSENLLPPRRHGDAELKTYHDLLKVGNSAFGAGT